MRDLQTEPLYKIEDLGAAIPDVHHACSVCFPTWQSVIDYEEGREKVTRALEAGYPRFVFHPDVAALNAKICDELAAPDQQAMVFPFRVAAQRAQRFLERQLSDALEIKSFKDAFVLLYPEGVAAQAKLYWRYSGEGISSRQAKRLLDTQHISPLEEPIIEVEESETPPKKSGRDLLAEFYHTPPETLHLWQSGMTAIYQTHRYVVSNRLGKKTLQIDFPYVDCMRVQQSFGAGVVFLADSRGEDLKIALERIINREFAAVYTEVPSNPLLKCPPIAEIAKACRTSQTPFIIDDTVASHYNVDVLDYADVVTTSLTKWVSGKGDVMAGATRINPESPFANEFIQFFNEQIENGSSLYCEDEETLLRNIEGFETRMEKVNKSGEAVADFLKEHPLVKRVYYPKYNETANFEAIKTSKGGYGGLLSIELKNSRKAPAFYDALPLTKGPSLGTEFTLVSPYTMLAHYDELEWAELHEVSQNLIRFSIGTEPSEQIIAALTTAFDEIA